MIQQIKVYSTFEELAAAADGEHNHIYTVAPAGIFKNPLDYNNMFVIRIYVDESENLHGLFYPKT